MIGAHVEAVLARLRQDSELATAVFDGEQETIPELQRYVVVWSNAGTLAAERLDHSQQQLTMTFWIHSVASTPEQARKVADRVFAQLRNFRPTVAGRSCWRMRHEASEPIHRDTKVARFVGVDQFDLQSTPA